MATLLCVNKSLRLDDHPALNAALAHNEPILAVYCTDFSAPHLPQGASLWWLGESLKAFNESLAKFGGELLIHHGDAQSLVDVANQHQCTRLYFSWHHEPWLADTQKQLHDKCVKAGIECKRFAGQLLIAPDAILNQQGKPYQVFTPFYKAWKGQYTAGKIRDARVQLKQVAWLTPKKAQTFSKTLKALNHQPSKPNWAKPIAEYWQPGEAGAKAQLDHINDIVNRYGKERDLPAIDGTSKLSPHLHFGELSPRTAWQAVSDAWPKGEAEPWLRQLVWREFSYYLLHHFPHIPEAPFKESFKGFPWQSMKSSTAREQLNAWQKGQTGYPLVDAGMRQLWQTGWMHNRVRMVVASFLTKHLRIHWHEGADWFWDTLVDADMGNNIAGWQWVAGSGADAAPYFRIFNPITQSEKFDKDGHYIREFVPELSKLESKYIHAPWQAPKSVLQKAGVALGDNYPYPIVDHSEARQAALDAYAELKNKT